MNSSSSTSSSKSRIIISVIVIAALVLVAILAVVFIGGSSPASPTAKVAPPKQTQLTTTPSKTTSTLAPKDGRITAPTLPIPHVSSQSPVVITGIVGTVVAAGIIFGLISFFTRSSAAKSNPVMMVVGFLRKYFKTSISVGVIITTLILLIIFIGIEQMIAHATYYGGVGYGYAAAPFNYGYNYMYPQSQGWGSWLLSPFRGLWANTLGRFF